MLRQVLAIQYEGDLEKCNAFIDKYTSWDENLHGVLAESMRASEVYRYSYVTYEILADSERSVP